MVRRKKQRSDKSNLTEEIKDLERYNLTKSEIEIVKLVARSFSNKEIAKKLSKSEGTVKDYLTNIYSKFGLQNRYQLIVYIKRLERKYKPQ